MSTPKSPAPPGPTPDAPPSAAPSRLPSAVGSRLAGLLPDARRGLLPGARRGSPGHGGPQRPRSRWPEWATPAAPAADGRGRACRALRRAAPALCCYAAVRLVGLLVLAKWTHRRHLDVWPMLGTQWDSAWYLNIAEHGYAHWLDLGRQAKDLAFFPLYPMLVRALAPVLPGSAAVAGVVLAVAASFLAAWGVFAVGDRLHGRRTGILLTLLWAALPTGAVQWMGYTESLFTALAAWSLYAVLTGRWLWAGTLSALAGLTRPTGVALAAAVALAGLVTLWRGWRKTAEMRMGAGAGQAAGAGTGKAAGTGNEPEPVAAGEVPSDGNVTVRGGLVAARGGVMAARGTLVTARGSLAVARSSLMAARGGLTAARLRACSPRVLAGTLLAPAGWLGFVGWVGARTGRWDGYFAVQRLWHNQWDGGEETWRRVRDLFSHDPTPQLHLVLVTVTLLVSAVLFVLSVADRQPLPLLVFTGLLLAITLGSGGVYPPRGRFLLPAFPLLLPAALVLARARPRETVLAVTAAVGASAYWSAYMLLVWRGAP